MIEDCIGESIEKIRETEMLELEKKILNIKTELKEIHERLDPLENDTNEITDKVEKLNLD